jgi:hypothetical protein
MKLSLLNLLSERVWKNLHNLYVHSLTMLMLIDKFKRSDPLHSAP